MRLTYLLSLVLSDPHCIWMFIIQIPIVLHLQLCQQALKCVQRCLYVQQGSDVAILETEITQPFSEEIATKMVLVLMLLMVKLQDKGQGMN